MSDRINWEQVRKWRERAGLKAIWHPFGLPEALNMFTSKYADIEAMPRWPVPRKVAIAAAITGAFASTGSNPNQPLTPEEIRQSAEECIKAGATSIHLHVRDGRGYNVLDTSLFSEVISPLRAAYPEMSFDGCLVAVSDQESDAMVEMIGTGLLDLVPVNPIAVYLGDSLLAKPPHALIAKTRLLQEAGIKPQVAVYTDGDIDNARRYLIDSGLLRPPFFWCVLPALPGCSPMNNPRQMIEGLSRMVNTIYDIDRDSIIMVCGAGRASTYVATLAMLMGLHVRVGMEDTIWKWPHRDDLIQNNAEHIRLLTAMANALGREVMSPGEYVEFAGLTALRQSAAPAKVES